MCVCVCVCAYKHTYTQRGLKYQKFKRSLLV